MPSPRDTERLESSRGEPVHEPRQHPRQSAGMLVHGGSADRLKEFGLPRPRALAYPHGACSLAVQAVARAAGYEVAFTVRPGLVARHHERMALPRIEVLASDTPLRLRLKIATARWPEGPRRRLLTALGIRI